MGYGQKRTMQQFRHKRPRRKLSVEDYNLFRHRVLERDGWGVNIAVRRKTCPYVIWRSKLGDDALDNLITSIRRF
jgi:hypothetical protein